MKRFLTLLVAVVFALTVWGCNDHADTWKEQYDLGVRYLSEGNYEEAIIAFNAAIDIDPKQVSTYIGLAEVYSVLHDTEQALKVLQMALDIVDDPSKIEEELRKQTTEMPSDQSGQDTEQVSDMEGVSDLNGTEGEQETSLKEPEEGLPEEDESSEPDTSEDISEPSGEQESTAVSGQEASEEIQTAQLPSVKTLMIQMIDMQQASITITGLTVSDDGENSCISDTSSLEQLLMFDGVSSADISDHVWDISMGSSQNGYEVSSVCFDSDLIDQTISLSIPQGGEGSGEEDRWINIENARMSYNSSSVSWIFTIPLETPFMISSAEEYTLSLQDPHGEWRTILLNNANGGLL